ncbi:MAG: DUF99 family protein [Methanosarcinales archaeon]|nr:DUF99 family protein [ANME-2 cluster archaeon]MDF1531745.1 DUF99 family protein [ANME-2 cluster archaeon]MDW7776645.1 DUF99 family protein [Methanosarcinales archaeon]
MHIKPEIRILGIDDSSLHSEPVMVVGAMFRGGTWLDGVLRTNITKDGMDATEAIIRMVTGSKHFGQVRVLMFDGVTYAGFNVVDIEAVFEETGIGCIVVMRNYPDFKRIRSALEHLPDPDIRWEMIQRAGEIQKVISSEGENPIFIQHCGIDLEEARDIVQLSSTHGNIPEPLRVAHLIATGIVCGESTGKA